MDKLQKLKSEIIEYGKLAGLKNFTPGYSGNFSASFMTDLQLKMIFVTS